MDPVSDSYGDRKKRVRPYPLHELPRLLLVQVELAQVFWRHLAPVLEMAEATTAAGWARLQQVFGGRLVLRAHDPYLFPGSDLEARVHGAALLRIEQLFGGAGQPVILTVDPGLLEAHPAVAEEDLLADEVGLALTGAPVRCAGPCAPDQALELLTGPAVSDSGRMCMALDLGIETAAGRFWGRLLCPAGLRLGVPPFTIGRSFWRLWQRRGLLQDAAAELVLEAGYGVLPAEQVAALEVGDVILLDRFGPRPVVGGPVWLRLGDGHFPGHLGGAGVTITSGFQILSRGAAGAAAHRGTTMPTTTTPEEKPDQDDGAAGPPGDAARILRELPVQIVCEIGRVSLTGAEVLELRPGTVLPVGRPLAGPVDLTVGGRVIARGELVDVEGEIGVRVVEVPG